MTKRFTLQRDSEWWLVGDNTIKVNENGYREDLTGEDKYRGLEQDLTEQEVVDLLNEQDQQIKELTNFKNKVFSILDEEIQYKKGLQELSEEKSMDMSLEKFTFELAMLMTIKRKLEEIE